MPAPPAAPTDDGAELFVVVDEDDRVVAARTRAECHADAALIHRSIHVVVETSGGTLYQRRGYGKDTGPGVWDTACAGHVAPGERYEDAAARELEEELGIVGADPTLIGTTLSRLPGETEMCGVFTLATDGPFRLTVPELAGLVVFAPGERPSPLTASAEHALAFLASRRAAQTGSRGR